MYRVIAPAVTGNIRHASDPQNSRPNMILKPRHSDAVHAQSRGVCSQQYEDVWEGKGRARVIVGEMGPRGHILLFPALAN